MKSHPFFAGLDWQLVYLQKYSPPLIPPRGEVNAADAFDIGSFDEEDTKGEFSYFAVPLYLFSDGPLRSRTFEAVVTLQSLTHSLDF